jgi:hypothetical protein
MNVAFGMSQHCSASLRIGSEDQAEALHGLIDFKFLGFSAFGKDSGTPPDGLQEGSGYSARAGHAIFFNRNRLAREGSQTSESGVFARVARTQRNDHARQSLCLCASSRHGAQWGAQHQRWKHRCRVRDVAGLQCSLLPASRPSSLRGEPLIGMASTATRCQTSCRRRGQTGRCGGRSTPSMRLATRRKRSRACAARSNSAAIAPTSGSSTRHAVPVTRRTSG